MSAIQKLLFTYEDNDGLEHGPVRVLAADKIAAEATARNQGWRWADSPRIHTLMGYFAAKRAGLTDVDGYPAFMDTLADFSVDLPDNEDQADEDPTPAATGPGY